MIRRLKSGEYRLYSRKKNPKTGRRRNLGTFKTRQAAEQHEREVQFFKRRWAQAQVRLSRWWVTCRFQPVPASCESRTIWH